MVFDLEIDKGQIPAVLAGYGIAMLCDREESVQQGDIAILRAVGMRPQKRTVAEVQRAGDRQLVMMGCICVASKAVTHEH